MKFKKIFVAIFTSVAATAVVYSGSVIALPDYSRDILYYADASMAAGGDPVGYGGNGCQGSYMYGQKTPYYTIDRQKCFEYNPPKIPDGWNIP